MTQKNRLTTVPDAPMLSLFQALVSFLTDEAQVRGWQDVSERLKAVEAVLTAFSDPGDLIYEPFCGSGTQIVAAERAMALAGGPMNTMPWSASACENAAFSDKKP